MIGVLFTYLALVVVEIFRNWCIIFKRKRRPTYWWSTVIRVSIAFIFWIVAPNIVGMNGYQWWGMLIMMFFAGWWVFDYGLNLVRRFLPGAQFIKPFFYLNPTGSFLDRLQCRYPNDLFWFWGKFVLMVASLQLYFGGVDIVWNPGW
jgi:hypothetical protein